jgi:hypothetical protein
MKGFIIIGFFLMIHIHSISFANVLPPDSTETTAEFEKRQYQKMIKKADDYFQGKVYSKAETLYQRAISFKPDWDNTYPKSQLEKIKSIKNQVFIEKYNRSFNEGLTQFKINIKKDRDGNVIKYTLVKVIVADGKAYVYEKNYNRGIITYTKSNEPISSYKWNEETNNPNLKRND